MHTYIDLHRYKHIQVLSKKTAWTNTYLFLENWPNCHKTSTPPLWPAEIFLHNRPPKTLVFIPINNTCTPIPHEKANHYLYPNSLPPPPISMKKPITTCILTPSPPHLQLFASLLRMFTIFKRISGNYQDYDEGMLLFTHKQSRRYWLFSVLGIIISWRLLHFCILMFCMKLCFK